MCRRMVCDCENPTVDLFCCPECDPRLSSQCLHQSGELSYNSGDSWIQNCQQCRCLVRLLITAAETAGKKDMRYYGRWIVNFPALTSTEFPLEYVYNGNLVFMDICHYCQVPVKNAFWHNRHNRNYLIMKILLAKSGGHLDMALHSTTCVHLSKIHEAV